MAQIDLSQLEPPDLIFEGTREIIRPFVIADLLARMPSLGTIEEGDPLWHVCDMIAAREVALRTRTNEGYRGVLMSNATGATLDQLGAFSDVPRLITDPSTTPPTYEGDDVFRRAVQTAPQTWGTGSQIRYERAARAADTRIESLYAATVNPTELRVEWYPFDWVDPGDEPEIEANILAALTLGDEDGYQYQMLTDSIVIVRGGLVDVDIQAHLYLDLTTDLATAEAAILERMAEVLPQIRQIRAPVPLSLVHWILDVDGVHRVDLTQPGADIDPVGAAGHKWQDLFLTSETATWL